jgi:hypothetical protein
VASVGLAPADAVRAGATPPLRGSGVVPSCQPADLIDVAGGGGALVSAVPVGGGPGTAAYLVTDSGVKYPIASSATVQQLGYGSPAVRLPGTVVGLLPTGPSLDANALANGGIVNPPAAPAACTD